jgi:hypothetical protein
VAQAQDMKRTRSLPPAAAGTRKTAGPTNPGQVLDAPLLRPEPRRELQKPSHPDSLPPIRAMLPNRRVGRREHLANLRYLDKENEQYLLLT